MIKENYLAELNKSKKPFIIYKTNKGFHLYTNFSKKIILTNKNINSFINKISRKKFKNKNTDLFIGFFGYEILNRLIGVKVPKQRSLNFPKGIFYKPETRIIFKNKLNYKSEDKSYLNRNFKNKRRYFANVNLTRQLLKNKML